MFSTPRRAALALFAALLLPFFATAPRPAAAEEGAARPLAATPPGWLDNYDEALRRAKAENKLVMVNFTGSDWCGLCQALERQVFTTPEFHAWAEANVVRLYIDLPQLRALPPALDKQNHALMQKFGIQGVPQIYFLTGSGEPLTSIGYLPGDGASWVRAVGMLLPKRPEYSRDLGAAYTANATLRLPVLVVAQIGDFDPDINAYTDAVLARPEIVNNSGDNLMVVRVDVTKLDTPSLSWWRNLAARNQLGRNYPVVALYDANWRPLFTSQGMGRPADAVAADVYARMPRPAAAAAYKGEWLDDYTLARKIARALNRHVLAAFVGSDWNDKSRKLEKDLFSTKAFAAFARDNLVLVKIDYPREKKLSEELSRQNSVLMQSFGIEDLPLAVILRPDGMPKSAFRHTGAPAADYLKLLRQAVEH